MSPSKTILITGGTSGLGLESALLLASQGHRVFAASRKPAGEPLPGVTYLPLDVRSTESIQNCVQSVLDQAGQIDVLINSAGYVGPGGASEEVALDEMRALFETNFFGLVQTINAVLPGMRQRRSGLILNISSGAGRMAVPPFFGFYAASKHAVEGYSEALSSDLRPLGIRVALIEPGYFATNIHNSLNLPANPLDDYAVEREHAMAVDNFSIRHGHNPRKAAQLVSRLVNRTPRRLRYPIWLELHSLLLMRSLLPARTFEGALRWLTLGGQPVKTDDDDAAIRRKIGFRRYMLESRLSSRLILGSGAALVLFLLAGLFFLLWPRA